MNYYLIQQDTESGILYFSCYNLTGNRIIKNMDAINKILIVKLSAIGDVVHALPCLYMLRKRFPDAYIAWAVEEKAMEILDGNTSLDEIITINTKKWRAGLVSLTGIIETLREIYSVLITIRRTKFDVAIDIQGLAKSGVIGLLSGAKIRIGLHYLNCREVWNIFFTNRKADAEKKDTHIVEKNLAPLKILGIDIEKEDKKFFISVPQHNQKKADLFLKDRGVEGVMLIGINPGAAWETKLWVIERYARVADIIASKYHAKVLLLWGNDKEEIMVNSIYSMMENKPIIPYKSSIKELCALLRRCDLIIGPDTGPIHIADALGVPAIVLYGPSSPSRNMPYRDRSACISGKCDYFGCYKRKCKQFICMDSITVEDVTKAVDESINAYTNRLS